MILNMMDAIDPNWLVVHTLHEYPLNFFIQVAFGKNAHYIFATDICIQFSNQKIK